MSIHISRTSLHFCQCRCVSILSRASFDKCHDVIKEEVLLLFVGLLSSNDYPQLVVKVIFTFIYFILSYRSF